MEDSFDWLSSADETENYGYEDDQNDWYDYEDYNEADFEGFYDNNEHSDSASDFTIYYSSSSNTEYYDSEDWIYSLVNTLYTYANCVSDKTAVYLCMLLKMICHLVLILGSLN